MPDLSTPLEKLPRGMQWRMSADGPRIRVRVRGRHIGTFDTVTEARAAQLAAKRGEPLRVVPAPTLEPALARLERVVPESTFEIYHAFMKEAAAGTFHSKRRTRFGRATLTTYDHVWYRHLDARFGDLPFTALTGPMIFDELCQVSAEAGLQVAIKAASVMQTTARYALNRFGFLLYNEIQHGLKIPEYRANRNRRPDRIIQPDELPALLEGARLRDAQMSRSLALPAIVFLVKTGARPSEALALTVGPKGLDLDAGAAHIWTAHHHDPDEGPEEARRKTDDAERIVPLDPSTVGVLRAHIGRTGGATPGRLVWRMPDGRPVSLAVLRRELAAAAALGNLAEPAPVPYDLRRTYVSYAFAAGTQEAPLARLLGHRHGGSLARQRYAQALRGEVERVPSTIDAFLRSKGCVV